MSDSDKNLQKAAQEQLLQVAIPGSGVITKSGKRGDKDSE